MASKRRIGNLIFLALLLAPGLAAGQSGPPAGWEWPGPWHMWWGGWGMWWIFPLLIFGFMLLCVFLMLRGLGGHSHWHGDTTSSALRLLNERFAKGEISKEELEEKRAILSRGP